ncbi:MAG TPA: PhzF family phenazine biosynthesis protein [Bacteroidales bacterium]|nr:PhzF family phenazine biosynthesis protein [Bacteroidales bacterium]
MRKIKIYQVDAFTDKLFSGNPAAVCILESWLSDDLMQSIANENNLAETAFVVPEGDDFFIRWFTPSVEVDLCGHATLASAYVIFNMTGYKAQQIRFHSMKSGLLTVSRKEDILFLDFPSDVLLTSDEDKPLIEKCIGIRPIEVYKGKTDYLAVVDNETAVRNLVPNLNEINRLNARGLIVTAEGDDADFVSRFFAPQSGVDEDPVTGSAHTSLIPFWWSKKGRMNMKALQLSKRGGNILCEYRNDRCIIGGKAKLYLTGEINTA